jgi:hypothetical protein
VDTGSSQAGVLGHHLEDQIPNFGRWLSSANGLLTFETRSTNEIQRGAIGQGFRA